MKTGVIEAIKKAQSGEKSFVALKISGDWYSLWSKLDKGVGEGSKVRFDYQKREKNGKEYRNITEIHPAGDSRDDHIDEGKLLSLKAATRFLSGRDVKFSQVINVAEEFKCWLNEEPEERRRE